MENSVDSVNHIDVLVIGAGPAGLCLGYHLKKLNISYLILDQHNSVGSSWRQMPDHLHLITLWKSNFLVEEDKALFHSYEKLSAGEYADYLEGFQNRHELNTKLSRKVERITQENNKHIVHTSEGRISASIVVDCRGYFNFPFFPSYQMSGELPLMIHFKDYKNRKQFDDYQNILIVGKRLSAGQLIAELSNTSGRKLFLSIRSPLQFGSHPVILKYYLRHLDIFETLFKLFSRNLKKEIEVPMDYNVKKVIEREVEIVPDINRIEGKTVVFADERKVKIDAIIFATGFKPPEIKLKNDFESSNIKNMFVLGRNSQRTFASRFIRGIREDAEILGKLIRGTLESNKRSQ